jgi:hypothetical protein
MRTSCLRLNLIAATLLGAAQSLPAAVYNLTFEDTTGAQTFINSSVGYSWDFSFNQNANYDTITATFEMKKGTGTTAAAVVSIYALGGGSSSALLSASLAVGSASNVFSSEVFTLASGGSGFTFLTGTTYRLTLTSSTGTGNDSWLVKQPDTLTVNDDYNPDRIIMGGVAGTYNPNTSDPSIQGVLAPASTGVPDRASTLPLIALALVAAGASRGIRATRS